MTLPLPGAQDPGPFVIRLNGWSHLGIGVLVTLAGLGLIAVLGACTGAALAVAGAPVFLGGVYWMARGALGIVWPLVLTIDQQGLLVVRRGSAERFRVQLATLGVDHWQLALYGADDTLGRAASLGGSGGLCLYADASANARHVDIDTLDRKAVLAAVARHTRMVPAWIASEAGPAHRGCLIFLAPVRMVWTSQGFRHPEPGGDWDLEAVSDGEGVTLTVGPRSALRIQSAPQPEASAGGVIRVQPSTGFNLVGEGIPCVSFYVNEVFRPSGAAGNP